MLNKNGMLNKKGSAMIWAVCTLLILMLVITATLTSSAAYHARSVRQSSENQAYLTARSAVDVMLAELGSRVDVFALDEDGNATENMPEQGDILQKITEAMPLLPHEQDAPTIITSFNFPSEMGEITDARITRNSGDTTNWNNGDTWTISATAKYANQTETVTAIVQLGVTGSEASWETVPDKESLKKIFNGVFINYLTIPQGYPWKVWDLPSITNINDYSLMTVNNSNFIIRNLDKAKTYATIFYALDGTFMTSHLINDASMIQRLYSHAIRGMSQGIISGYTGVKAQNPVGRANSFGAAFKPEYDIVTEECLVPFYEGAATNGQNHINPNYNFRILPAGNYSLDIKDITGVEEVFIFLQEGAHLSLTNTSNKSIDSQAAVFVYSVGAVGVDAAAVNANPGNYTKATLTVPNNFEMKGSLIVDRMIVSGNKRAVVTIHYVEPTYALDSKNGDNLIVFTNAGEDRDVSQAGSYTFTWDFKQYK